MSYIGTFEYVPRIAESLRDLVLRRVFFLLGTTTNHLSRLRRCSYFTKTRPPSLRLNSLVPVDSSSSPMNVTEAILSESFHSEFDLSKEKASHVRIKRVVFGDTGHDLDE